MLNSYAISAIAPLKGQDPFVTRDPESGNLILIQSVDNDRAIALRIFNRLPEMALAQETIIWRPSAPEASELLWGPEIHRIGDHWYVYFTACDGDNLNYRLYVLQSVSSNPLSLYREKGKLSAPGDASWAIDFTTLEIQGNRYGIWSSVDESTAYKARHVGTDGQHEGFFPQSLYIAPMSNPWTFSGPRQMISTPEYPWEMSVEKINEAPQAVEIYGKTRLFYSADASWTSCYRQGMLTLEGSDPLDPHSWVKHPQPVFDTCPDGWLGVGHVSFVLDEPECQGHGYLVYHTKQQDDLSWSDRCIRYHAFDCDENVIPRFMIA